MWKKLEKKKMHKFYIGILSGIFFIAFALLLFKEISFIIGGIGMMMIGFSFLYYLKEMKRMHESCYDRLKK